MSQRAASVRRRPGRPPGGRAVADRAQLVAAAVEVIRSIGPDATMDDIAAGAHVTKPTLYRTIGDKAALTNAVSESLVDQINSSVAAATLSATDPHTGVEAGIRGYLAVIAADRNLFLFVNAGAPGTEQFRDLVERSAAAMVEAFTDARARVGLEPDGSSTWAWAIVGALQVIATMWLRDHDERHADDLDRVAGDLSQLLWFGLGPTLTRADETDSDRSARDRTPRA